MTLRFSIAVGMTGFLAACSWSSEENPRPNDPYAELGASQVFTEKGVRYMEGGHYEIALKDLKRAVELDGDNSEAYNALAVLYQRVDDPVQAEANFRKALSVKPDNFGASNNYGRFLCSQGRYPEAFGQFQQVIGNKLYSQPWIPLTNAGVCARSAGRMADAERYLREALEVNPDFPPALLEMARLSRLNGQLMSARAFLQRYFAAAGPGPEPLALGIDIETALGNSEVAREYANTLRTRFPESREAAQARRRSFP